MNLIKRFDECKELLASWQDLLSVEALKHWPNHLKGPLEQWVGELNDLTSEELWAFQNNLESNPFSSASLKALLNRIREVTQFERPRVREAELPRQLLRRVRPKKKHELDSLIEIVDALGEVEAILDIGGGVGHLSSALVYQKKRYSYCVDANIALQEAGTKRILKWDPDTLSKIKFIDCLVDEKSKFPEFEKHRKRLVIGLHSCGKLGTDLVKIVSNAGHDHFVLASCCYHKLQGEYNISNYAKRNGIIFSENALHLAARCHRQESFSEFQNKLMVRRYRYALHLLEYKKGRKTFTSIGNTKLSDYKESFYTYIKKYSQLEMTEKSALDFYNDESIQSQIQEIISLDIFRALFGRVIETYLILDRALYLKERSYRVDLLEGFDRALSPRNLVLVCSKT